MQLVPALTRDPRIIARERPAGHHLPYARHVDDVTIETRDGSLLQIIRLGGLLFETADTDELNYRSQLRDAVLRTIGSAQFAIYHHVVRRKAEVALEAEFPDAFSRGLNERWQTRLGAREMYVNDLFLTIVRRPLRGRMGWADKVRSVITNSSVDRDAAFASERRALSAAVEALVAALGSYDPRVLRVYHSGDGPRSEPLEFLSYLYNLDMRPVGLPFGDLGLHLPFRRVSFGQDAFELAHAGHLPSQFGAIISIKDYPAQTLPGMFDELCRMPF
jgi:type IV secretion system protein VirB4